MPMAENSSPSSLSWDVQLSTAIEFVPKKVDNISRKLTTCIAFEEKDLLVYKSTKSKTGRKNCESGTLK